MVDQFLSAGWHVLATTRHAEADGFDRSNVRLQILSCNVAESAGRETIVQYVAEHWSEGVDCLINNAGYGQAGPLEALTEEQIRQQFEVNFFAPVLLTRDLLLYLRKVQGKIINISSVLGFVGMPMQSMYAASKFALEGLTESLYYELSAHGIKVCLIEPGGFRTQFADNMVWPSDEKQTSPLYQQQMSGYRNCLERVRAKPGKNPDEVARIVVSLANRNSMPLRVRIGDDTRVLYYLRRTLPQQVADRVLRRISGKILESK